MTNEEITALALNVSAQCSGSLTGLVFVIRAMQAQPGFDHPAFVRTLAGLSAAAERLPLNEVQQQAFEAMIQQFDKPAVAVPPSAALP